MKKFILTGILLAGGAGIASADDFSFSLSFGDRPYYREYRPRYVYCPPPRRYYRPVYYRHGYRPGYYYNGYRWVPRRGYRCD
jgi:hypothetical protein